MSHQTVMSHRMMPMFSLHMIFLQVHFLSSILSSAAEAAMGANTTAEVRTSVAMSFFNMVISLGRTFWNAAYKV